MATHQQKTILITGCSSGIGLDSARQLKSKGYRVFATARKTEDVEQLQNEGFDALQLDLQDSKSIHKAVAQVLEKTNGQLDVLFNNGAVGQPGAVEDLTRDVLRQQFEINLFGTHELTNLIIPVMRKQGYGKILYTSSVLGFVALKYRGAYNASKFALEGLVDTLRLELKGTQIYPVLIEPGPILTKFRENAFRLFTENINVSQSAHAKIYEGLTEKLGSEGPVVPFTLGPEAVTKKVITALDSSKPSARYYVTFPTYLLGYLKRLLPDFLLDKVLLKI
ncbi:MAG TPA: SDR family NAD(P)-dependent oxidoreductase [Crenotrichaceae bacterium]|nr:SDR family NAD(P)-dependent oxidoreductase [Crenotrichaceae bacterium]